MLTLVDDVKIAIFRVLFIIFINFLIVFNKKKVTNYTFNSEITIIKVYLTINVLLHLLIIAIVMR